MRWWCRSIGSVSVSGDVAAVGASRGHDNGINSGAAYVFRFDGTISAEEQKLLAANGAAENAFGGWVSICGDVAVI